MAEYVAQKLAERNIEIFEIITEDWGYYLPIRNEGFRLALCCGHQYGGDDKFIIFTDPKTPKIRQLFHAKDATPQLTLLIDTVKYILENDPDICDINWREP